MADKTKVPAEVPKKPEFKEVAASRDRDLYIGYVGEIVGTHDPILRGVGGDLDEYRRVMRDHQVKSCWQQRVRAVTSAEWDVEPGGKRPIDKEAAEFAKQQLQALRFDALTAKMANAFFYGYAVGECLWVRDGNRIVLRDVRVRKQERFGFDRDGALRLRKHLGDPYGEPVPPAKFWVLGAEGEDDDDPHGLGLAHWLYWPVFLKRNGAIFWATALEKFGMPTAAGAYPGGSDDEAISNLLAALRAIHGSSAVAFPEGFEYKLLEAQRTAGGDHEKWLRYWDSAIAKVILSQTMTTDDGSSRAQAEVHQDVGDDVTKGDADLLCESFNTGPMKWLTAWNFPGAATPRVWRRVEPEEDLNQRAEREEIISRTTGLRPTRQHVEDTYGGHWETKPEAPPARPPGQTYGTDIGAEFAEAEGRDAVDDLVDQVDELAAPLLGAMVEDVRRIVDTSPTLEAAAKRLSAAFAEWTPGELEELLARGMMVAHLEGTVEDG